MYIFGCINYPAIIKTKRTPKAQPSQICDMVCFNGEIWQKNHCFIKNAGKFSGQDYEGRTTKFSVNKDVKQLSMV